MKLIIIFLIVLILVYLFNKKKSKFALTSPVTKPKTKLEIAKENAQISVDKQQALLDSAKLFKEKAIQNQTNINALPSTTPNLSTLVEKANKSVVNATDALNNAIEGLENSKKALSAFS